MYARVARFEGNDPDAMRRAAESANARGGDGPPEGVPAKGFLMLTDPENGRSLSIVLFETEEDMRAGDAVLKEMSPDEPGFGQRVSLEYYEMPVELRMP